MKDKVVLITGGSQGYGKAAAKLFADNGAKVIIAARNEDLLKEALRETGCASYISMDVTSLSDWETTAYNHIVDNYGRVDVLINNVGGAIQIDEITDMTNENIDNIISLNLNSIIYGSKTFANLMKKQKSGTIINVASVCAKHAWPGWSIYTAAKWGVLGFSKNLYVDLRPYGIRVTCLIPGAGSTDFMKHAGGSNMDVKLNPEDVASAMLNICTLPSHVVIEEMIVWGNDQEVIPL